MKIFRSESLADYDTYTFNYAIYCKQENDNELDEIYRKGFLPYSDSLQLKEAHYYLARSLRVELDKFASTSENRRLEKKFIELNPQIRFIKKENFNFDEPFYNFCMNYAQERFDGHMPKDRFDYILQWKYLSHIIEFKTEKGELLGYVFAVKTDRILHYWFSFYNLEFSRLGIGKWMMYKSIELSKERGLQEVYLGTCYGEKAMYKMRDFKGLSYFDGNIWQTDMKKLKQKCKMDSEKKADEFKLGFIS